MTSASDGTLAQAPISLPSAAAPAPARDEPADAAEDLEQAGGYGVADAYAEAGYDEAWGEWAHSFPPAAPIDMSPVSKHEQVSEAVQADAHADVC